MINSLYQWLLNSGQNELLLNFKAGYLTGVMFVVALLIIIKICQVVFFNPHKRVKEVIIPGGNGSLVISSGAISDMVQAVVCTKFKCITINKIILWRGQQGIAMELQGSYDIDGGRLPEVAAEMRDAILKNLDGQLGIDTVKEVIPNIKKITSQNLNPSKFK